MSQTLEQFQAYQTRLEQYDQAIALLYWDLQTAAPKDSIEAKLSAVGYFSTESFRLSTADEYGSLLKKLSAPEEYEQLSPAMQLAYDPAKPERFRTLQAHSGSLLHGICHRKGTFRKSLGGSQGGF